MADEKKPGDEQAKEEALPKHLADPDYVGPLTGDQAQARIAKFGHFRTPATKPAANKGEK